MYSLSSLSLVFTKNCCIRSEIPFLVPAPPLGFPLEPATLLPLEFTPTHHYYYYLPSPISNPSSSSFPLLVNRDTARLLNQALLHYSLTAALPFLILFL